jgi:hypothetical protein
LGSKDNGARAAEAILHTMRDYSVWMTDGSPVGQMKDAALEAFRNLPPEVARPAAEQALKSENANERLFAVTVLPSMYAPSPRDAAPHLVEMLDDPSLEVRNLVMSKMFQLDPTAPALRDALRKALANDNQTTLDWVLRAIESASKNPQAVDTLAGIVPDLLRLLDRGGLIESRASESLRNMGLAALDGLEKAINAEGGKGAAADKARKIYDEIRSRSDAPRPASRR